MTRFLSSTFVCLLVFGVASVPAFGQDNGGMSDKEKTSYSIGVQFGNMLTYSADRIDPEALLQGLKDAMQKQDLKLTQDEMNAQMAAFQQAMMEDRSQGVKKEGEDFLAKNAKTKGVTVLPSGLQYKVIEEGTGKQPKADDTVRVHYRGTFVDGTQFDSSYDRNQPAEFPVNRVIPGWTEALQKMKEGGKWKVWIPYDLAYGEQGRQGIPPYSALVFDVELLKVVDEPAEGANQGGN